MLERISAHASAPAPQELAERVIRLLDKVIYGKTDLIRTLLTAVVAGGHVLLEDVPGVGKTRLIKALATVLDCEFRRIQGTPDLLPSDVTGVSVYRPDRGDFEFRPGPLHAHVVLADELNRTPPRTQAALLEAMEERRVTVDGTTYKLPEPFMVLATQNPYGWEGTYALPEAMLDRFLIKLAVGYPDPRHEVAMLGRRQDGTEHDVLARLRPVVKREELIRMQRAAATVHVDDAIRRYIVDLVSATRNHRSIRIGASPRASFALLHIARAAAWLDGRGYVIPDDVKTFVPKVLEHRLAWNAHEQLDAASRSAVLHDILARTPVPYVGGRIAE